MRVACLVLSVSISSLLSLSLVAQQTATSSPQAQQFLQQSLSALAGRQTLTDVTLSGTARRIAGSDDETGTVLLQSMASGETRTKLAFPSGPRTELRAFSKNGPVGQLSGPDGVARPISQHNLMTDSSAFFPTFTVSRLLFPGNYVLSDVAHETRDGQTVEHLTAIRQFQVRGAPPNWTSAGLQRLSQMEIYLDSRTLLPSAILFNTHPDSNQIIDILIEIRFSDYHPVNGGLVPFHVQKYLNNSLTLDLQFDTVTINTGLSPTNFNLQ